MNSLNGIKIVMTNDNKWCNDYYFHMISYNIHIYYKNYIINFS